MGRLNKENVSRTTPELPREKALRHGMTSLSDSELLALLLDTGSKKENVIELSSRMLFEKGGLKGIFTSDVPLETYGVKKAKSFRILAVKEILKRLPLTSVDKVSNARDAFELTKGLFLGKKSEISVILFLDRKKNVLYLQTYDLDLPSQALVPIDHIIKEVVRLSSSFVLLLHNHPSGILLPSKEDIYITTRLAKAISYVGAILLDSLIVSDEKYFSFRQKKLPPYVS